MGVGRLVAIDGLIIFDGIMMEYDEVVFVCLCVECKIIRTSIVHNLPYVSWEVGHHRWVNYFWI